MVKIAALKTVCTVVMVAAVIGCLPSVHGGKPSPKQDASSHSRGKRKTADRIESKPFNDTESVQDVDLAVLRKFGMASDDSIPVIYPSIAKLKRCRTLKLGDCGIRELPPEIGTLRSMENLYLGMNHLTTLPIEIIRLGYLENFDIDGNDLDIKKLSPEVVRWLYERDSCWLYSQKGCIHGYDDDSHDGDTVDSAGNLKKILFAFRDSILGFELDQGFPEGRYFALVKRDSSCRLDTVYVIAKHDSISDICNPPKRYARVLYVQKNPKVLLFIRGISGMRTGPVKTWYLNSRWVNGTLYNQENMGDYRNRTRKKELQFDDIGMFTLAGKLLPGCNDGLLQWQVRFGDGEWRTMPILPNGMDMGLASGNQCLLWIGDIDGDAQPDVLLNPTLDEYDAEYFQLFLSRQYKSGQPWKIGAEFYYSRLDAGCH